jgi:hypothetical protein
LAVPARLHVLLARASKTAVVLRRGPSKQVCSFLWNRRDDSFTIGQWLKGRIYERRADLSPDGRFLIYFAMNGRWKTKVGGSWTAISRAPWLKAIELIGKGDCWEGGGLFLSKDSYWLNDRYFSKDKILQHTPALQRRDDYAPPRFGAECTGVYYPRLLRDGWTLIERRGAKFDQVTVFEKSLPNGWTLRKTAHEQVGSPPGKGCYWDEHELAGPSGEAHPCPGWEWAERDRSRLVWAEGGCLYQAPCKKSGIGPAALLHDFNAYRFEAIQAPYGS